MKKKLIGITLSVLMILSLCMTSMAASGTWQYDGSGWWYAYDGGGYACGTWESIDGDWYHFDEYGYMQTGWINDAGSWYYLNPDGTMAAGWICEGDIWYYMDETGAMVTGWQEIDGAWYYFDDEGRMYTNSYIDQKYFVDINGQWDGVTISDIPETQDIPAGGEPTALNETKLTFHEDGWYVARMEVELWDKDEQKYTWLYSDSRAKGQKTTLTIDTDKYEINRVGYQIWFFGWDNDYMNLPWANTDYATDFTLSGSGDYPEFTWK